MRVLTLNIWGLAWPLSRDLDLRVEAIGRSLPGLSLDAAAFQEVWSDGSRNRLIELGGAAGLRHAWFPPEGAGGLLVLSRHEPTDARFSPYHLGGLPERVQHFDYWGDNGFATVTLKSEAGAVALVTTHLHAAYRARSDDEYIGHRTGQVVQLAAALARTELPLIALGDFNFREDLEEYRVFRGLTGLRDLAAELDHHQKTILASNPYRKEGSTGERIDYIFQRDGARISLIPQSIERVLDGEVGSGNPAITFSDHAGLLTEFSAAPGGAPRHSPDPVAIELAKRVLAEGRNEATQRRTTRLRDGSLGLGLAVPAALFALTPIASRRRFLRACCIAAAGIAGAGSGLSFALERFASPEELEGYDTVLGLLDRFPGTPRSRG